MKSEQVCIKLCKLESLNFRKISWWHLWSIHWEFQKVSYLSKNINPFSYRTANAPSSGTSSPVKRKHVSHERENASKLFPRTTGGGGMSSSSATSSPSTPNPADAAAAAAKKAAMLARLQAQSLQNAKEAKGSMDLLGSIMSEMKKN